MQNRYIIYIMLSVHKRQLISSLQRRNGSCQLFWKTFCVLCQKDIVSFLGQEARTPVLAYCIFLMLRLAALAVCCPSLVECLLQACVVQWLLVSVCIHIYMYTEDVQIYIRMESSRQISVQLRSPKVALQMPSMKFTA